MMMSSMTPLRRNAVVALLDAALPNHARLPIMAQSPWGTTAPSTAPNTINSSVPRPIPGLIANTPSQNEHATAIPQNSFTVNILGSNEWIASVAPA